MRTPLLTAPNLVLDAPCLDDAPAWWNAQDEECAAWFDWPGRPTLQQCTTHLRRVVADELPDTVMWAIRTPDGFAGGIDFARLSGPDGHARWNVSYFVDPAHRGLGVATGALRLVCAWAFDGLGVDAVTTRVHVDNLASQRVLEKVGFACVGEAPNEDADHLDRLYELRRPS